MKTDLSSFFTHPSTPSTLASPCPWSLFVSSLVGTATSEAWKGEAEIKGFLKLCLSGNSGTSSNIQWYIQYYINRTQGPIFTNEKHRPLKHAFLHLVSFLTEGPLFPPISKYAQSLAKLWHPMSTFLQQIKPLWTLSCLYSSFICPYGTVFDCGKYYLHIIPVTLAKWILLNSILFHTLCETKWLADFFPILPESSCLAFQNTFQGKTGD